MVESAAISVKIARAGVVGGTVVPKPEPVTGAFWPAVASLGGPRLRDWVDYVGIDMYPDVFGGRIERAGLTFAELRSG
jgi:hypothetical protein